MERNNLKGGWGNIDGADNPFWFVSMMDRVRGVADNPAQYVFVKELLEIGEGQRVLDVGCGTGPAVRVFAGIVGGGGMVVGLDKQHDHDPGGQKALPETQPAVRFQIGRRALSTLSG